MAESAWPDAMCGECGDSRMIRTRTEKLVSQPMAGRTLLFDLIADPRESADVAGEADRAPMVKRLTSRLDEFFAVYDEPGTSGSWVTELPRHNGREAWRDQGRHDVVPYSPWLTGR